MRLGALEAAGALEPSERLRLVSPLLSDPIRTIRIQAAQVLTSVPAGGMTASERAAFEAALAEYVQSQRVDADRAESHLNLGSLYLAQGDPARAEAEYRTAIALMPAIGGGWANLADVYRAQGREEEAEKTLRRGLETAPRDPGVHHALGLALVRSKRMPEALVELRKAAELPPDRVRYDYVYGVALDSVGQTPKAIEVLAAAHVRHPANREILEALASFSAKAGDRKAAVAYAEKLLALAPESADAKALLETLRGGPPGAPPR